MGCAVSGSFCCICQWIFMHSRRDGDLVSIRVNYHRAACVEFPRDCLVG